LKTDPEAPQLVQPHGGKLTAVLLEGEERAAERARAEKLPVIHMTSRETSDLIMLAIGAFSPLTGFMTQDDYRGATREMRLANGTLWPIPISLSPRGEEADVKEGDDVALVDEESGELMGTMRIEEKYSYDKQDEARNVFGTDDAEHPGVAKVYAQSDVLVGGPVKAFGELDYPARFPAAYARPHETRAIFRDRGWHTVAAFQTRNPMHRSHEYCTKIALEICDGLLIHPLVGKLKQGDIPADVRMKCYQVLMDGYYPADRVVCRVYPMEMRYGGPREAVLHAVIRQNFGCSHLIVGRDHAGVGSYYGPFDAQDIFDAIEPGDLAIRPLKIDWTFWCHACEGMASTKTCPHDKESRVLISGTELRKMLAEGKQPPHEFTRPEIAAILSEYYASLQE
jgi:sulfate adenylyltransferase